MRRRYIAIAVAAALMTGSLEAPGTSKAKECTDHMTWVYDQDSARASFKLDLPKCWKGKGDYKVKAWIERHDPPQQRPQRRVHTRKCTPAKVCRIWIEMDHPTTEATTYRASIEYMATRNGVEVSHRVFTCASHGSITRCEQA